MGMFILTLFVLLLVLFTNRTITSLPFNIFKRIRFTREHGSQLQFSSINRIHEENRNYYCRLNSYFRSKDCLRKKMLWAKKESRDDLKSLSEQELLEMDLSQLIELIRKEDTEWLDSVLDIGVDDSNQTLDESISENSDNEEEINGEVPYGNDSMMDTFSGVGVEELQIQEKDSLTNVIQPDPKRIDEESSQQYSPQQSNVKLLQSLGYTNLEVSCMKDSVLAMIKEGAVRRPGSEESPLPRQWFKANTNPYDLVTAGASKQVPRRKPITVKPDRRFGDDGSVGEKEDDEVGSAVRWRRSAAPSQDERKEAVTAAVTRDVKSKASRPVRSYSMRGAPDPADDIDDDDDNYEFSFWPSEEEFKDLLLDESRMRVEIAGDWMTPFVKEETKWRYRMYKDWLRFLEDGFGDAFDVVEDAFEEGQDGGEQITRQPRNPTAIREKLVSRDDPSYSISDKKRARASGSGGDSASSIMGDGLKGAPVPIPVLKSEVKKVRAMLDNAAIVRKKASNAPPAPESVSSRKGSRAALYDEYIRKISEAPKSSRFEDIGTDDDYEKEEKNSELDSNRREVYDWFGEEDIDDNNDDEEEEDTLDMTQLKTNINSKISSRSRSSSSIKEQRSNGSLAPKKVLKNDDDSVDNLDEIDYINIRNPRSSR